MLIISKDIVCSAWLHLQDIQISHARTATNVLGLKVAEPGKMHYFYHHLTRLTKIISLIHILSNIVADLDWLYL